MSIAITGLGIVSPLGSSPEALWTALLNGECAAKIWPDLESQGFRISSACRAADFLSAPLTRGQEMATAAVRQAINNASIDIDGEIGLFVGTTMGESAVFEAAAEGENVDLSNATGRIYSQAIQNNLGLKGSTSTYSTACAAGNYAINAAAGAIRRGEIDYAIGGGVDAFSRIAMLGFSRIRAMSPDLCRPFDLNRQGMQLGEAAAFVLMESTASAIRRRAHILAEVVSLGLSCDAFHSTSPRPDGSGMASAMRDALETGGVSADDVDFICAHGTGTIASDSAEASAINKEFPHSPPVFSIKGAVGHSLGAATAVETVISVMALINGVLPPTTNTMHPDPAFNLDVVIEKRSIASPVYALNCGYGFGGINSALLLRSV